MRMTNKIMQNNSLYNINNNKILQDKLSTQMSTQKKLTRPSDDPVVAIRALRLRTSVTELKQFYEKNAPDADSWLEVTGKALSTVTEVLTDMGKQVNKGANKDLATEDLEIIVEQMKSLRDEFYATGNVDYAGRYVFTGYRTDTTMSFTEEVEGLGAGYPSYEITEQNTLKDFDTVSYTDIGKLAGMNKNNYTETGFGGIKEGDVSNTSIYWMRLAYDDLKGETTTDPTAPKTDGVTITIPDAAGGSATITAQTWSKDDGYKKIADANAADENLAVYIPETGEILFSNKAYSELENKAKGDNGTYKEIQITYTKDSWRNGDLRPEHYFACKGKDGTKDENGDDIEIKYNQEYLTQGKTKQTIEYDVGYNQKIQVNTTADEVFNHNLDRDVDDMENTLANLKEVEAIKNDMEEVLKGLNEEDATYADVKKKYDAAVKAYDYLRESMHNIFENAITKTQGYLDDTNVAITDNGTRSQRLDLISNRLMDQKTTFQTLQSENEDADIAEVAVQLTSTELTYEAALMATGKIMQTSLMNYI